MKIIWHLFASLGNLGLTYFWKSKMKSSCNEDTFALKDPLFRIRIAETDRFVKKKKGKADRRPNPASASETGWADRFAVGG